MGAGVDVHRVGSDLQQRHRIMKHRCARSEDGPIVATHSITAFTTAKCCKVERSMDECVQMGEVDILAEWISFSRGAPKIIV